MTEYERKDCVGGSGAKRKPCGFLRDAHRAEGRQARSLVKAAKAANATARWAVIRNARAYAASRREDVRIGRTAYEIIA